MRRTLQIALIAGLLLMGGNSAIFAQEQTGSGGAFVRPAVTSVQDTISSNGDAVTLTTNFVGGFGQVKIQTLDSYSGDWEVQCSLNGTTFDAGMELKLSTADTSTTVTSVSDTVGIWDVANAGGCKAIKVIAIAGFAASDTVVVISAMGVGGGSGGGGSSGSIDLSTVETNTGNTATSTATSATHLTTLAGTVSSDRVNINLAAVGGVTPTTDLTFDMDSGAGTQTRAAIGLAAAASGGAVQLEGTTANGLEVDITRIAAGDTDIGNVDLELAGTAVSATNPVAVRLSATGAAFDTVDPCSRLPKLYYVVNNATAGTTEIANAVASEFWYICSINLVGAAAQTFLLAHDDSDSCGSLTAGMNGGTTAGTGWSFAANGGIVLGNGLGTVMKSATANHYLCYAIGQSVQTSGTIAYVSAP